jgi:predicted flap endonuclease-1-like 5' DNA nuclease
MAKIDTIEGIGPALSEKLAAAGIDTCEALLQSGASKKGRSDIAEKSGMSEAQILKFVNAADLMRIKGVGGEYAELLECSGVDTVPELAQRNAANLTAKLTEVNLEKKLVRALPTESQVEAWIDQAKSLPKTISH